MSADLTTLPTPNLVLDRDRCLANADAMATRMAALGVRLRPHLKTAKSAAVARLATARSFGGVTVSTWVEAAALAQEGFDDIRLAVCPSPATARRAARLASEGVGLSLIVDDAGMAAVVAAEATAAGVVLPVLVEVDTGEHRTGVAPDGAALLDVARAVHAAPSLRLAGVLTHAGHAYGAPDVAAIRRIAEEERAGVVFAAQRLRAAGLPCDEVSAGSTPTACHAQDLTGVTEMRPGVYLFGDCAQVRLGSCGLDDVALSVLATVIANRPHEGALVIDAGGLALSKDHGAPGDPDGVGYGRVCDLLGRPLDDADGRPLCVADVHQEHGAVPRVGPALLAALPVGSRVRVLPHHACMTAAAHDRYHVVEGEGLDVCDVWSRCNGWWPPAMEMFSPGDAQ